MGLRSQHQQSKSSIFIGTLLISKTQETTHSLTLYIQIHTHIYQHLHSSLVSGVHISKDQPPVTAPPLNPP